MLSAFISNSCLSFTILLSKNILFYSTIDFIWSTYFLIISFTLFSNSFGSGRYEAISHFETLSSLIIFIIESSILVSRSDYKTDICSSIMEKLSSNSIIFASIKSALPLRVSSFIGCSLKLKPCLKSFTPESGKLIYFMSS